MKIALDYDGTITQDPVFWSNFCGIADLFGHEVRVVTFRNKDEPIEHDLGIPVIYTSGRSKRSYCRDSEDFIPDVWIDDQPELIPDF